MIRLHKLFILRPLCFMLIDEIYLHGLHEKIFMNMWVAEIWLWIILIPVKITWEDEIFSWHMKNKYFAVYNNIEQLNILWTVLSDESSSCWLPKGLSDSSTSLTKPTASSSELVANKLQRVISVLYPAIQTGGNIFQSLTWLKREPHIQNKGRSREPSIEVVTYKVMNTSRRHNLSKLLFRWIINTGGETEKEKEKERQITLTY